MTTFIIGLVLLIVGGAVYGKFVEHIFHPDDRQTPAIRKQDGVDFVPMSKFKNALINLLNIAGTGPIFGPIQGILFGPIAFITIPIGCVISGATHDYLSGMISLRQDGAQMPGIVRKFLGNKTFQVYNIFLCILMLLVGAVFTYTPGDLFANQIVGIEGVNIWTWVIYAVILAYYLIATLFPIDKIIGRIYPIFGAILLLSAVGVFFGIFFKGYELMNIDFSHGLSGIFNVYPLWDAAGNTGAGTPFIPVFFVTVACGAISGFHSLVSSGTTSKQLDSEGNAKLIGYGSMLLEGVLAVVAVVAVGYVGGDKLTELLKNGGPVNVFADGVGTFMTKLGFSFGVAKGFVALTISAFAMTTLDTATRLGRFIFQELFTKVDPKTGEAQGNVLTNPFVATLITVVLSGYMSLGSYLTIWPIFGAANQLLAALSLLAVGVWLKSVGRDNLMVLIPMAFMFCVTLVALAQIIFANMAAHIITAALGSVLFILAIALFLESRKYLFGGTK